MQTATGTAMIAAIVRGCWSGCLLAALVGCSHPKSPDTERITAAQDINRDTDQAKADNTRAADLIRKGKYDQAESLLQKALAADAMYGPAHNNLGKVYYHQNKLYQAAWEFEYASKLMPQQPEPLNNLGLVFEATGRLDEAIKEYDEAIRLDPNNPQYLANAARARIDRGDHDDVLREILSKLVLRETRPEWIQWAKDKLSLMRKPKTE